MRVATAPAAPGAVLLVAGGHAPLRVRVHQPVVAALGAGCAGQARSHGIQELLRQSFGVGAVHPERPDALDHRVAGGEGLRGEREGRRREEGGAGKHGNAIPPGGTGCHGWCA